MRMISMKRINKMLLILPKKMPEEIFSCNKYCFCVEYLDFSKQKARIKYKECFKEYLDKLIVNREH